MSDTRVDRKKILIVSGSFFPGNSPRAHRTTQLAKELAHQGHEVTVLVPEQDYDFSMFMKEYGFTIKSIGHRSVQTIKPGQNRILRILERVLFRIMLSLFEYPAVKLMFQVNRALRKERGHDTLISIAVPYPIHWGVLLARKPRHPIAPVWVADCGDPYTGFEKSFLYKAFYLRMLTRAVFRKCSHITVPFDGAVQAYPEKFRSKIKVIPQGFDLSNPKLFKGKTSHPVPTFAYAGSFIPGRRDPRPFIDDLIENGIDFKFVIYTTQQGIFSKYSNIVGKKLFIHGFVDREELLFELSKMDFLINFHNRNEIQLPSKIIDYALTGRPILSLDSYNLDHEMVSEFLAGNYRADLKVDLDKHNIKHIAKSFLLLT